MHKLVVLLLLAAVVVNVNAATISEILDNIDVEVKLQARSVATNNYDFTKRQDKEGVLSYDDYNSFYDLKTEVSLKSNITDDLILHGKLELSEDKTFAGGNPEIPPHWLQENIELMNVYFEAKNIANIVNLRIGRQEYGEEYKSFVAYFDKLDHCAVELNLKPTQLTVLKGKIKDPSTADRDKDESIYGVLARTDLSVGALKFAVYGRTQEGMKAHTLSNVVCNVVATGDVLGVAGLSYEAELAYQTSQRLGTIGIKHDALAGRLKGIYTMDTAAGKWRFAGEYLYTSGDKTDTKAKYEGYTGVNINYTPFDFVRLGLKPISYEHDDVAKDLDHKNAFAVNVGFEPAAIENLSANFYLAKWNYADEKEKGKGTDIGLEFAVCAGYTPTENLTLCALLGYFSPGNTLEKREGKGKDSAIKLATAVGVKF